MNYLTCKGLRSCRFPRSVNTGINPGSMFCTSQINSCPGWAVSSWQLSLYHLHLSFIILTTSCMLHCGLSCAMENISPRNGEFQLNPREIQSSGSTSPLGLGQGHTVGWRPPALQGKQRPNSVGSCQQLPKTVGLSFNCSSCAGIPPQFEIPNPWVNLH